MKTKFYIFLILLLSYSFANAQSEVVVNEGIKTISNKEEVKPVATAEKTTEAPVLIDAEALRANIARSTSDIRVYFNKERNVDNLSLLFPKINREVKA